MRRKEGHKGVWETHSKANANDGGSSLPVFFSPLTLNGLATPQNREDDDSDAVGDCSRRVGRPWRGADKPADPAAVRVVKVAVAVAATTGDV